MADVVNWGVLGAANFALNFMARAIHGAKGARLAALATSSPDKAAPFQDFAPDLRVHDSYEALLADPEIEAVYIPLPNHVHVEWAIKALEAGKHVLCEKPLAMRADRFDAVIAARDSSGLLAAEAYMIVHHPQWQKAKALYEAGAIGKLRLVDGVFSYNNPDMDNIRNRPETGGGSLPDIGVYTFGSARFVTGEEPLRMDKPNIERVNGVDVFAHVTADFPSFRYSSITSMRMAARQEMAFHGDQGVIRLTAPFNAAVYDQAEVTLETGEGRQTWRYPGVNQYVLQVENFCRTLREGAAYPCPLEFSRGTQAMIDMVWAAE